MELSVLNMKCGSICRRNAASCALESSSLSRAVSVIWRAMLSRASATIGHSQYQRIRDQEREGLEDECRAPRVHEWSATSILLRIEEHLEHGDHVSATALTAAKAARCTASVRRSRCESSGIVEPNQSTSGVASAHGNQDASSVPKSGSHCGACPPHASSAPFDWRRIMRRRTRSRQSRATGWRADQCLYRS